jgi:hypothetical protein
MKKIVFFLLILPFACLAQQTFIPGYVVDLKGDTLKGEIRYNPKKELDMYSKVGFKEVSGAQRTFKPEKIKAYGYDGKVFVSATIDGEAAFYKTLSHGAIDLFETQYETLQMNDIKLKNDFFMKKNGSSEFIRIKHNKFKKQLAEQMSDNSEIVKQLEENKNLEFENIIEVFNQYNSWAKTAKS